MSAIVGYRDKLLQAAPVRNIAPAADAFLLLTADTPVFHVSTAGAGTPAEINLTATLFNLPGPIVWEITSGTAALTGTDNTRQLAYSSMTTDTAKVRASTVYSGVTFQMELTITKVRDGEPGIPGADGPSGAAARIAYTLADGFSLAYSPLSVTVEGDITPVTGTWGETRAWKSAIDSAPAAGQAWFQSNGMYDPATDETVWKTPYLSALKVGSLEALAVKTGDLEVSGTLFTATEPEFRAMFSGSNATYVHWVGSGEMTDTNAVFYIKRNGDSYFGGSLSAGTLRTAVTNPTFGTNEVVVTGPFGSNGGAITVVGSINMFAQETSYNYNFGPGAGATGCAFSLYRKLAGGDEELVHTFYVGGTISFDNYNSVDDLSSGTISVSGSFTFVDPVESTLDRTYRLATAITYQAFTYNKKIGAPSVLDLGGSSGQRLTIITTE